MTDEPRAITGDYADFKLVRTRKVCQVVIELPIEQAGEVARLLGFPDPGGNTMCAVALVDTKQIAGRKAGKAGAGVGLRSDSEPIAETTAKPVTTGAPATKPKQRWEDMRPSARAAMMVQNPEFERYLRSFENPWDGIFPTADEWLKTELDIASKADLDAYNATAKVLRLAKIDGDFRAWQQAKGHGVI